MCKRVEERVSTSERKFDSGWPRIAGMAENTETVKRLACSQEEQP